MKDELEKYILENREAFDHQEPPEDAWKKIAQKRGIHSFSGPNFNQLWKAAAVVFFVIAIGLWLERRSLVEPYVSEQAIELRQAEMYYEGIIEQKISLVNNDQYLTQELGKTFAGDIYQLDSVYRKLKLTWEETPTERVRDAMIVNLQMRIELLNQQLQILETVKFRKNEKSVDL